MNVRGTAARPQTRKWLPVLYRKVQTLVQTTPVLYRNPYTLVRWATGIVPAWLFNAAGKKG